VAVILLMARWAWTLSVGNGWCHGNFASKDMEFDFVFGNKVGKMRDKFHIGQANENGWELFLGSNVEE
jgi:hypothetical protein